MAAKTLDGSAGLHCVLFGPGNLLLKLDPVAIAFLLSIWAAVRPGFGGSRPTAAFPVLPREHWPRAGPAAPLSRVAAEISSLAGKPTMIMVVMAHQASPTALDR